MQQMLSSCWIARIHMGDEYVKSLFTAEYKFEPPDVDGEAEEDIVGGNVVENDTRLGDEQDRPENAQYKSKRVCPDCEARHENKMKLDDLVKRIDSMDKKLDLIINLLGVK
ncbi:hypothetical protein Ddye_003240 [Dipteronia dyeriana]|uniref:Uncharacterized protein n=1 Tax=Dipteronia dyeriana TaxID=168575 RepID=A0AAD9XRT1_9ROSI|nr:hypothetical protein Ddye_003240 [Dipteronia dyeriana]